MNTWQNEYWEQRFKKEGRIPYGTYRSQSGEIKPLPSWEERKNKRTNKDGTLTDGDEPAPKKLVDSPNISGADGNYFDSKGNPITLADYKERVRIYANEWRARDKRMKEPGGE